MEAALFRGASMVMIGGLGAGGEYAGGGEESPEDTASFGWNIRLRKRFVSFLTTLTFARAGSGRAIGCHL